MPFRVYRMRGQGRRPSRRDAGRDEGYVGTIGMHTQLHGTESVRLATLRGPGPKDGDILPPLYEPVLVTLTDRGLMLRGFESVDGVAYVQEWRCTFE